MIQYTITDKNDFVLQSGVVPTEEQIPTTTSDQKVYLGISTQIIGPNKKKVIDGVIRETEVPAFNLGYAYHRRLGYPTAGEQIDVLWKFILAKYSPEELTDEVKEMLDRIQDVKNKIPKS